MSNSDLSKAFATQADLDHQARLSHVVAASIQNWPFKGHSDEQSFLQYALVEVNRLGFRGAYAQACGVRALIVLNEPVTQADHIDLVGQALALGVPASEFVALHQTFAHLGQAGDVWLEEEAELDALHCLRLRESVFEWQPIHGKAHAMVGPQGSLLHLVACDSVGVKGTWVAVDEHVSWLRDYPAWCQTRSGALKKISTATDFQQFIATCCKARLPQREWTPTLSAVFEQMCFGGEIHGKFIKQADYALFDARVFECQQPLALRLSDATVQAQSELWQAVAGIDAFVLKGNTPLIHGALSFNGGWLYQDAKFHFECPGRIELFLPVEQLEFHFNMKIGDVWSQCVARPAAPLKIDCDVDVAVPDGQLQAGKPLWEESRSKPVVVQFMSVLTVGGAVLNADPPVLGELTLKASLNISPQTGELDVLVTLSHSDLVLQSMSVAPALGSVLRSTALCKGGQVQCWSARHG